MFDTQNSTVYASDQPLVRDHSLAASFSKWLPKTSIIDVTCKQAKADLAAERAAANDWRTIGNDDPKPAPKQYTLGSIKHVTFQGKHNSVDAFPVKAGDVVTAISQFSWAAVQIIKFSFGDLIGYCWLSDLEEVK